MPAIPISPSDSSEPRDALVKRYRPEEPAPAARVAEIGGRKDGSEPTRFGDWEKHGRCIDF